MFYSTIATFISVTRRMCVIQNWL